MQFSNSNKLETTFKSVHIWAKNDLSLKKENLIYAIFYFREIYSGIYLGIN